MKTIRLYSFTLPLALWPLMDFSLGEVPRYLRGVEFRAFLSELITQVISGVADTAIIAFFQSALGTST